MVGQLSGALKAGAPRHRTGRRAPIGRGGACAPGAQGGPCSGL